MRDIGKDTNSLGYCGIDGLAFHSWEPFLLCIIWEEARYGCFIIDVHS